MQRADKRKYHYIYKITRDDDRYYIGMHSTDNLEDGYFGSGKLITRSIKKHGVERHTKEILEYLDSREKLKMRERELVNEQTIMDKLCMNLQLGGFGGFINEAHRLKAQACGTSKGGQASLLKRKGFFSTEAHAKSTATKNLKYKSGELHGSFTDRTHCDDTKLKISQSQQGKQDGEKNSQFGSCWITDGVKPIKIRKDLLQEHLELGYKPGRKIS